MKPFIMQKIKISREDHFFDLLIGKTQEKIKLLIQEIVYSGIGVGKWEFKN